MFNWFFMRQSLSPGRYEKKVNVHSKKAFILLLAVEDGLCCRDIQKRFDRDNINVMFKEIGYTLPMKNFLIEV